MATFRVATNEVYIKNGEKVTVTEWHRLVAFGRLAEICGEYLYKGSRVFVEGKIRTRKFEDKQGQVRYITEILVQNFQILDRKGDSLPSDEGKQVPIKEEALELEEEFPSFNEEDIPF